jgi:hypothetical protein
MGMGVWLCVCFVFLGGGEEEGRHSESASVSEAYKAGAGAGGERARSLACGRLCVVNEGWVWVQAFFQPPPSQPQYPPPLLHPHCGTHRS